MGFLDHALSLGGRSQTKSRILGIIHDEVKKNGCEDNFPFFIVPSLFDKKMDGPFSIQIYSEKAIVIQMLDDEARKL